MFLLTPQWHKQHYYRTHTKKMIAQYSNQRLVTNYVKHSIKL